VSDSESPAPKNSDEVLLFAALSGQPRSWEPLLAQLNPYLQRVIRRRAGDLPEDLHEEIAQEVWAAVARGGPREPSDPSEPARVYILRFLSPAIDRIRSVYREPGSRSRWRNESPDYEGAEIVPLESLAEYEDEVSTKIQAQLEARLEVEGLLAHAGPLIALAAMLMLTKDLDMTQAAGTVGIHRLALHRGLRALGRRRAA
jgi:DNA-directed RNA polymerase specialized sigma24 family protein